MGLVWEAEATEAEAGGVFCVSYASLLNPRAPETAKVRMLLEPSCRQNHVSKDELDDDVNGFAGYSKAV